MIGQYADDADIYQMYSKDSVQATITCLNDFQKITGFTVSYEKTQIYRIGSLKNSDERLDISRDITWTNGPINVLGVAVDYDYTTTLELNYGMYTEKVSVILKNWHNRNLSLIAKVNVVNTLIGSLFVYKMSVLPRIPESVVKRLENIIMNFIWSNRKPKIALKTLQSSKDSGGLGLVNLRKKDDSLKICWVSTLLQDEKYAMLVYKLINSDLKELIWQCNTNEKDIHTITSNPFWMDVLKAWARINFDHNGPILTQIIWFNSHIRIKDKPFFWKQPFQKGYCTLIKLLGKITL